MDNDFNTYQSLMNTDNTLNDISNILQQLQIIQAYFIQNPNYIIYSDGSSTYLKNSAIQDNTIDESKIINLITDLGNKQPLSDILTKLSALTYIDNYYLQSTSNGVQWSQILFSYLFSNFVTDKLLLNQITTGTNNYVLAMSNAGILNYQLLSDNNISSLTYKKLIWQTQPSTINQYQFISYDYTNDKLTASQYINSSTMIADGAIAGAKIMNATVGYQKFLTYNNPSDLQFLKYNLTQDKLEYITLTGSLFSDNTITYNKLGTKTNNYAFITTDATHANIIETVIDTQTKFNNYFSNTIIDLNKLNCYNYDVTKSQVPTQQYGSYIWYDMSSFIYSGGGLMNSSNAFTLTQNSYSSHTFNYNNTYSSYDNSVFFNSSIYNSSYGTKQSTIQIRNYGGYMQYLLSLDGYGMLYCSSQSNYISNGSTSGPGVQCPNYIYGGHVLSGSSSFYGNECITKSYADGRYALIGGSSAFGYNTNFVQRYEGYYFRTYGGSYSDHTYFMSSNSTSAPGVGTSYSWAALICGGGSYNYILEGRNYASQSSTMCYINSGGYFYTGSQKKNKNNIQKYNDIDDDNDFNVFNIIKNIDIIIFDYSNKEKKTNETKHENLTKGLIKEDIRETGIIIEDLEDQIKNNKHKKNTADILQSFITYDHRLCEKNNDMLNCSTNTGNFCQKFISYNSIYNLNVHATKKLIKKVEKQHDIITDLQTRLTNLENLIKTITNKV